MAQLRLIDDYIMNVETDEVVFYRNDVDPEVVENSLNIFNRLQSVSEVDEYLLNEEKVTSDEREFITEALANLITTEKETEMQEPAVTENQNNDAVAGTDVSAVIPGFVTEPIPPAPPAEKPKRQWTRRATDGQPKLTQSTSDFIKAMEEKIEMVKILDQVTMPELPGTMTKSNRDIMVEFQKEHAAMVTKYMQKIQQA